MNIENQLRESLREKSKEFAPPQELKQRVLNRIALVESRSKFKRHLAAGIIAVGILIPTSGFTYQAYLADELYGSLENIIEHFETAKTDSYMLLNAKLLQAKGELSQSDYEEFKHNLKVITSSKIEFGNQYGNINYDQIPQEKVSEIKKASMLLQPYFDKLNGHESSKTVLSAEEYERYIDALMTNEKILVKSEINPSKSFSNEDIKPELLDEYLISKSIIEDVDRKVMEAGNEHLAYMPNFSINNKKAFIEYGMPTYDNENVDIKDVNLIKAYADGLKAIEVQPNTNLKVTFAKQPDSIKIQQLTKEGKTINTNSLGEITFPKESGLYTIVITGKWGEMKESYIIGAKILK